MMAFLLALGGLILFHEWGHYGVARLLGVKVLRFSVGFGRPLWKRRWGKDGTEWVIGMLPLGGFVRMLDEREGPVPAAELSRAFNRQSLWRRSAIVAAGPLANFMLAWILFSLLYMVGVPGLRPCLDEPAAGSLAAQAGLHAGQCVEQVAGRPIHSWQEFQTRWVDIQLKHLPFTILTRDQTQHTENHVIQISAMNAAALGDEALERMGLVPWNPPLPPIIGRVVPKSVAARAGFLQGDHILTLGGQSVSNWMQVVQLIENHPQSVLAVQVLRDGQVKEFTVIPQSVALPTGRSVGRIGVSPDFPADLRAKLWVTEQYSASQALWRGGEKTLMLTQMTFRTFWNMLSGQASWDNLGGPVRIASIAGESARLGLIPYLQFIALISLSLGVLNLLPIPLLDGGHLLYHALEWIRGKPLSPGFVNSAQQVGFVMLVILMGFSFYNDLQHFINH
ncbi:MAG: RIP metalloprotease RseP [Ferrovum sp.]|nr:RIP metalloprotease RseP [Ferrovum sp.]NDU86931.1 RIP metalloprotease RseP [Ferrovum sp.]